MALPASWAVITSLHPTQSSPGNDFVTFSSLLLLLRARLDVSNSHPSSRSEAQLTGKRISSTLHRNTRHARFSHSEILCICWPSDVLE